MKTRRGTHQVTLKAGQILKQGIEVLIIEKDTQVEYTTGKDGHRVYRLFGKLWNKVSSMWSS